MTFSIVPGRYQTETIASDLPRVMAVTGLAVAEAVAAIMRSPAAWPIGEPPNADTHVVIDDDLTESDRDTERGVSLKWPNDVLVDHRKVAGLLGETHPIDGNVDASAGLRSRRRVTALIVGVGINIGTDLTDADETVQARATSLAACRRDSYDLSAALAVVVDRVDRWWSAITSAQSGPCWAVAVERLNRLDPLHGRTITVGCPEDSTEPEISDNDAVHPSPQTTGVGSGWTETGALRLRTTDEVGQSVERHVISGEVVRIDPPLLPTSIDQRRKSRP